MRKHLFSLVMVLIVASLALAACGGGEATVAAPQTGGDTAAPQTTGETATEAPAAEMTDAGGMNVQVAPVLCARHVHDALHAQERPGPAIAAKAVDAIRLRS